MELVIRLPRGRRPRLTSHPTRPATTTTPPAPPNVHTHACPPDDAFSVPVPATLNCGTAAGFVRSAREGGAKVWEAAGSAGAGEIGRVADTVGAEVGFAGGGVTTGAGTPAALNTFEGAAAGTLFAGGVTIPGAGGSGDGRLASLRAFVPELVPTMMMDGTGLTTGAGTGTDAGLAFTTGAGSGGGGGGSGKAGKFSGNVRFTEPPTN
jgi:hypothetical protein